MHLTIDQERCIQCNRCVQDCPMGIPETDGKGHYFSNEANAEVCIYCGHCVAVCPARAITLHPMTEEENLREMADYGIVPLGLSPEECQPTSIGEKPSVAQLEALMKSRRMTRSFTDKLVDRETVRHMLQEVLVYAPSGHNTRGYRAIVVEGRQRLERLTELSLGYFQRLIDQGGLHSFDVKVFERMIQAWKEGKDRVFRTARQAVVVCCKTSQVPSDPAVKVLLTYFELLANAMGLGTVWAGYFMVAANDPAIKELLGVGEDETVYGAMMFGYPEFVYDVIPKRPDIAISYMD